MKIKLGKIIALLAVAAAVVLPFALASCSTSDGLYNVLIDNRFLCSVQPDISNYRQYLFSDIDDFVHPNVVQERTEKICDIELELIYDHSSSSPMYYANRDYYEDADGKYEVAYSSKNGNVCLFSSKDLNGSLFSYDDPKLFDEAHEAWIMSMIDRVFAVDVSEYSCSYSTSLTYHSGNSQSSATEDGIVTSDDENVKVESYAIRYTDRVGEYGVADNIYIRLNTDGGVSSMVHFESEPYNLESITVDHEKLDRTVEYVVGDIIPSGYRLRDYSLGTWSVEIWNGRPYLVARVNIEVSKYIGGADGSMAIDLAIDLRS